ncbi:MAG TPA: hypothetical protein VLK58_27865 [Conexibacter sp.]|nr:hypothetical protein [Conexibacter sp.]
MRGRAPTLRSATAAGCAAIALLGTGAATAQADVRPVVDCVVFPTPPATTAKIYYGFVNDGATTPIPFGDANTIMPGLGYQGQPELLVAGTYRRVFSAIWNTAAFTEISWELNGHSGIATAASPPCRAGATGPLSDLTPTSATLHGTVGLSNLETAYVFEWGVDGGGAITTSPPAVVAAGPATQVQHPVLGLRPATAYRFRLVATDADGTTSGEWRVFETPAAPLPAVDLAVTQQLSTASLQHGFDGRATVTVTNRGATDAATDVVLTTALPSIVTARPSAGCEIVAEGVRCAVGTLAPGAAVTREIAYAGSASGRGAVTTLATAAQPDPTPADAVAADPLEVFVAPGIGPLPVPQPPAPVPRTPPTPQPSPFRITARAAGGPAVAAQARRCPLRLGAGVALTSDRAGRALVTATSGRRTIATRRVTLRAGTTTVTLCLDRAGRRAALGPPSRGASAPRRARQLAAGVRIDATAGTAAARAETRVRFTRR